MHNYKGFAFPYTAGVLLLRNELAVLHLCGSAKYLDGDGVCLVAGACDTRRVNSDPVTVRWWIQGLPAYQHRCVSANCCDLLRWY